MKATGFGIGMMKLEVWVFSCLMHKMVAAYDMSNKFLLFLRLFCWYPSHVFMFVAFNGAACGMSAYTRLLSFSCAQKQTT